MDAVPDLVQELGALAQLAREASERDDCVSHVERIEVLCSAADSASRALTGVCEGAGGFVRG